MALRRSLHLLGGARARAFSSDAREAFNSAFAKVAPLLDAPHFGSDNLTRPEPAEGAIPEKLTLNFFKPHGIEFKATEVSWPHRTVAVVLGCTPRCVQSAAQPYGMAGDPLRR